jgi:hypothetical protein
MLVAMPSPVLGITISSGATTRCSPPRTKVKATSSPRAGHADVSPAPSLRAYTSVAVEDPTQVAMRIVPTKPSFTWTIRRLVGWLDAQDSIKKTTNS